MSDLYTEQQILDAIERLPPEAKKSLLRKLLLGLGELEAMIERNEPKFAELCQERGLDFYALSEEERESLLDDILHEKDP